MRSQFLFVLIVTSFFSGWYFYKNALPCIVPQTYSVGVIDPRFNLATSTAKVIIEEAKTVWEDALGRALFQYDENSQFSVQFIYDERQDRSDKAELQKELLAKKEQESEKINGQYAKLTSEYDALKKDYEVALGEYKDRLYAFNSKVIKYNEAGGAPPEVFAEIQNTENLLKKREKDLEGTAGTLAILAKNINTLSEQGNSLISEYNKRVVNFNENFSGGEQFTQGDYTGEAVHVYHFQDDDELRNVLIHEFGHALGLTHVEGNESIMYYLMDRQPDSSELSSTDLAALNSVCKSNDSLSQIIHTQLSSIFIKLHLI